MKSDSTKGNAQTPDYREGKPRATLVCPVNGPVGRRVKRVKTGSSNYYSRLCHLQ